MPKNSEEKWRLVSNWCSIHSIYNINSDCAWGLYQYSRILICLYTEIIHVCVLCMKKWHCNILPLWVQLGARAEHLKHLNKSCRLVWNLCNLYNLLWHNYMIMISDTLYGSPLYIPVFSFSTKFSWQVYLKSKLYIIHLHYINTARVNIVAM